MKQIPKYDEIQKNMAPGIITRDGFLGQDRRKLMDIIIEDDAEVKRLGLTHAQIAGRMKELSEAGMKGLGLAVKVETHFEIQVDSVRGKLPSPFQDNILIQKMNTRVKNTISGQEIIYTDLNIHMIEKHGFYEGKGSLFRTDPALLAEVLEIRADKS